MIYKFRTMTDSGDYNGNLLSCKKRLTPLGRLMRKMSIDELPQLWNIVKGDLSLVGPRPLLKSYLPYYSDRERKRHLVRPGITGLAQVNGRNLLNWDDRLELDVQYVENVNIIMDISILFKTVCQVIRSKDVLITPGTAVEPLNVVRKRKYRLATYGQGKRLKKGNLSI